MVLGALGVHIFCATYQRPRHRNMIPQTTRGAHKSYLKVTAVAIGCFGPIFLLGSMAWSQEPARYGLSFLSQRPQEFTSTTRFLSALSGGFLMGWGTIVWCLQAWVYDAAPEGVRRSVVVSCLVWFVCDTTGSILSGNPFNMVQNALALLIAVGPMWCPALEDSGNHAPLVAVPSK